MRDVEPLSDGEWSDEVITAFQDNIDFDFSAICPNRSQVETAYAGNSYEITLTYIDEAHGKDKDLAIEYHKLGLWKYSNKILNPEDILVVRAELGQAIQNGGLAGILKPKHTNYNKVSVVC